MKFRLTLTFCQPVKMSAPNGQFTVTNMKGEARGRVTSDQGLLLIKLSPDPVYLAPVN